MPHNVRGALGLETSASTGLAAPWSWRTASAAAGVLTQLAWRAAQAGTATGVGSGVTEGLGVGVSSGDGLGVAVGDGLGRLALGLAMGASGPLAVHPATAASNRKRTTPFLTTDCNEQRYAWVTGLAERRKSHRIPPGRLAMS